MTIQGINRCRWIRSAVVIAASLVALPVAAPAALAGQVFGSEYPDVHPTLISRQDLVAMKENLEQVANSSANDAGTRERARQEAQAIASRLETGDFYPGDQVELVVEDEEGLTGTFIVDGRQAITLPVIGMVSLRGVLRSELREHMIAELGRFIQEPVVYARSLTRLAVLGAVARPGYYLVAPDAVLSDVLMVAGGPLNNARIERTEIRRGGERVMPVDAVQAALGEGQTLDRMSLQAGDQIVVPERGERLGPFSLAQMLLTTVPVLIATVVTLMGS